MKYQTIEKDHLSYISIDSAEKQLDSEKDALDVIALTMENGISRVLIHSEVLSERFFDLSTRIAGDMLLKLSNYHVKTAVVLKPDQVLTERFSEFRAETNRGKSFGVFDKQEDAENWLLR